MKIVSTLGMVVAIAGAAGAAQAAVTLTGTLTADNAFQAFISTSDNTLGTLVASGTDWQHTQTLSAALTPGTTYYLHIIAWNYNGAADPTSIAPGDPAAGNPDMLVGSFSLSGGGFKFANGGSTLDTEATDWRAALVGSPSYNTGNWTAPGASETPTSFGTNGTGVWAGVIGGAFPGIGARAEYIWASAHGGDTGETFFSTTISSTPEPAAWALMLMGVGGIGGALRSRRQSVAA